MRSFRPVAFLALVVAAAPGDAVAQASATDSLRLGPGDAVRVEAYLTGALATGGGASQGGEFQVDAEGYALLPVLGLTRVGGQPFGEVRRAVEDAYAAEFVDARVRVTPLVRVALLGEVRSPGLLTVDPTMALADVVAAAGGLTPAADRRDVRLIRSDGLEVVTLGEGGLSELRLPVRSGDRIVVGRRSWVSENLPFLLGAGASVLAAVLTAVIVR